MTPRDALDSPSTMSVASTHSQLSDRSHYSNPGDGGGSRHSHGGGHGTWDPNAPEPRAPVPPSFEAALVRIGGALVARAIVQLPRRKALMTPTAAVSA